MIGTPRRSGRDGPPVMNTRGQVTVPWHLRQALRIGAGSLIEFRVDDHGQVVMRAAPPPAADPDHRPRSRGRAVVRWRPEDLDRLLRETG